MAKKYLSLERLTEYHELNTEQIEAGDAAVKSYVDTELTKKASSSHSHSISNVTNLQSTLDAKAAQSSLDSHTGNTDIHVTTTNKSNWNSAYTHSTSTHAPTNAEKNIIVGIQKNGTDLTVNSSTRKVNITVPTTAADIGAASSSHNHDSAYDTKGAASSALTSAKSYSDTNLATAKSYTDGKISALLDGADDTTLDSIKELADAIKDNDSAIDALNDIASGKANATHSHAISDVSGLQSALDGKAAASHGTHVTYDSTNKPKMDGTAAFGTSSKVARADHVHPTDTSRASQTALDNHIADSTKHITSTERTNWGTAYTHSQSAHAPSNAQANVIESIKVNGATQIITSKSVDITVPTDATDIGAAPATHGHAISDITNLQTTLNNAANAISTNTGSIEAHTTRISALETKVGDGFEEITSAEIQALFS